MALLAVRAVAPFQSFHNLCISQLFVLFSSFFQRPFLSSLKELGLYFSAAFTKLIQTLKLDSTKSQRIGEELDLSSSLPSILLELI